MRKSILKPPAARIEVEPMPDDLPDFIPDYVDPRRRVSNMPRPSAKPYADTYNELAEMWSVWGHAMPKKKRIVELLGGDLDYRTVWEAKRLIKAGKANVETIKAKPVDAKVQPVDWADDRVERFIVELTRRDADHGQKLNYIGWNPQHSPTGHWCNAMLKVDREAAIRVGRTIVGSYMRQIEGRR